MLGSCPRSLCCLSLTNFCVISTRQLVLDDIFLLAWIKNVSFCKDMEA